VTAWTEKTYVFPPRLAHSPDQKREMLRLGQAFLRPQSLSRMPCLLARSRGFSTATESGEQATFRAHCQRICYDTRFYRTVILDVS
jgi:hypothetical protein